MTAPLCGSVQTHCANRLQQKSVQAERDSLQQRIAQLEAELASARAASASGVGARETASGDVTELQSKYDALLKEKEQWDEVSRSSHGRRNSRFRVNRVD